VSKRPASDQRLTEPTASLALLICLAGCFALQPLATDAYLPSLPLIGQTFQTSPSGVQHTLSFFIFAFGMSQVLMGPVSDRFGRRPVALTGLLVFVVASLLAWWAPSLQVLVVARVLQAFGVCCTVIASRTLVRDRYEPAAGAQVLARASSGMAFVILLCPLAGGLLAAHWGWRSIFIMLTVLSFILLVWCWRTLEEPRMLRDRNATRLRPLVNNYWSILKHRDFQKAALISSLNYGVLFVYLSGTSYVFVKVLKLPVDVYGYYWVVATGGYLIGSFSAARSIAKSGLHGAMRRSVFFALSSGILMAALAVSGVHHPLAIAAPMGIFLFGHSRLQPCLLSMSTAPFPNNAGAASALVGFIMHAVAAFIGWWIALSFNGTVFPLTLSFAIGCIALASTVWILIPRSGK
jgi:MFS transporter, DHA1 family, multidrug resistance protein